MPSPVVIFCYNRLDNLKCTVANLQRNTLACDTELYIFSDGPSNEADTDKVAAIREYVPTITGFRELNMVNSPHNKGLATSIIEGVTEVLKKHETVIVLEDDLLTSTNFLSYMNDSLDFYKDNRKILSISGYSFRITFPQVYVYDNYFTKRSSSWGWGTWRNRWNAVDWDVKDYNDFVRNPAARKRFNLMGSDMAGMLDKQMKGKISSWAIRWCYHQFKTDTYTAFPSISKVQNIGFGDTATHTSSIQQSRFATSLDTTNAHIFKLNPFVSLNNSLIKQFVKKYSVITRLKYKALSLIPI
ncbi:glycosyltransferase [Arcticibacter sp.]|uniref:glycosyltransferase n=1 Tax=Arcticibacter sp. TaxID=1872630 RepID=UPI00388F45DB